MAAAEVAGAARWGSGNAAVVVVVVMVVVAAWWREERGSSQVELCGCKWEMVEGDHQSGSAQVAGAGAGAMVGRSGNRNTCGTCSPCIVLPSLTICG